MADLPASFRLLDLPNGVALLDDRTTDPSRVYDSREEAIDAARQRDRDYYGPGRQLVVWITSIAAVTAILLTFWWVGGGRVH